MKETLFAIFITISFLSCTQSPKIKDTNELGKEIFYLFKKGEKSKIIDQLITKDEVEKVFITNPAFQKLNEVEKKESINSVFERTRTQAMTFIEFYTDEKKSKESIILQKGNLLEVFSHPKNDNGPPATRIQVLFQSGEQKYFLKLDASKIDDYWKLLSWIEVEQY